MNTPLDIIVKGRPRLKKVSRQGPKAVLPSSSVPTSQPGLNPELESFLETDKSTCLHCRSDLLGSEIFGKNGERFCCEGCRVVYGILSCADGGLYYELLDLGKTRAPRGGISGGYREFLRALRDPKALRGIGRWQGTSHSLTLECSDMQCAACGWLMERVLGQIEGVLGFDVDFIHGEINLRYDAGKNSLPTILENLGSYGYSFRPVSATGVRLALDRTAWMRLAVAAACFLNAMAFSLGPYMGFGQGMSPEWRHTLGAWSFAAALPAVFYSAFPFYRGAWRALKGRAFTIDVTVTLGIFIAFSVSLESVVSGGTSNYSDTLSGLVFFLLLGRFAVRRFEGSLVLRDRWHESMSPGTVRVFRGANKENAMWIPLEEVLAEDLLEVEAGSYLPVDGIAFSGSGKVDTAFLTGENRPRPYGTGDFLFAGYRVLGAPLRLRVVNPHEKTRAAFLQQALESMTEGKRRRNLRRERVALGFTLLVISAALVSLFLHRHAGWSRALETSAAVFIVSCSCALALAVPVSRGVGLLRAHRLGFHFRDQETLERLADIRSAIFDKTGTLTFTRRSVMRWEWLVKEEEGSLRARIRSGAERLTRMSFHPVSVAVHDSLDEGKGEVSGFEEIPHFGVRGNWRDFESSESPLKLCLCSFGAWDNLVGYFQEHTDLQTPPTSLLSPLSAGETRPQACLFADGRAVAFIWISEELKPGAKALVRGLHQLKIPALLLSGDHHLRVRSFAKSSGFRKYRSELSPEDKQREAHLFQRRHGPALAVGDGFNDSLVFGEAEVALAVQGAAAPMADGADAFMTSQNPESILSLLRIARGTRRSLRNCYVVSAIYNGAAISLAMMGFVSPLFAAVLMPMASLSLFATALLTIPKR